MQVTRRSLAIQPIYHLAQFIKEYYSRRRIYSIMQHIEYKHHLEDLDICVQSHKQQGLHPHGPRSQSQYYADQS